MADLEQKLSAVCWEMLQRIHNFLYPLKGSGSDRNNMLVTSINQVLFNNNLI